MVRRSTRRTRGAGYLSPAEFFNPAAVQPESSGATISSEPMPGWVRPPLSATSVIGPAAGGRRRGTKRRNTTRRSTARRNRKVGGFAPAAMGSFVANAQAVAVPIALYGLYHMLGLRKTLKSTK